MIDRFINQISDDRYFADHFRPGYKDQIDKSVAEILELDDLARKDNSTPFFR